MLLRPYLTASIGRVEELAFFDSSSSSIDEARGAAGLELLFPTRVFAIGLEAGASKGLSGPRWKMGLAPTVTGLLTWYFL